MLPADVTDGVVSRGLVVVVTAAEVVQTPTEKVI